MWARSSTPTPASSRQRPTGDAHGGGAAEVVALAHEVVVVGVGAAVREHPAIAGHAERLGPLGRAQDAAAAPCSTALLEFIRFVYGKPIIRLSGDGVRISSAV